MSSNKALEAACIHLQQVSAPQLHAAYKRAGLTYRAFHPVSYWQGCDDVARPVVAPAPLPLAAE